MQKGDVYLAELDPVVGSEQAGTRPVVIVQNSVLNRVTRTVVAVPFTTNLRRAELPSAVLIPRGEGGLYQDSVALCYYSGVIARRRFLPTKQSPCNIPGERCWRLLRKNRSQ